MLTAQLVLSAFLVSAAGVYARTGLSVALAGPERISAVAKAVISAKVTNTGDETVRVLNTPTSVLSKVPSDVFAISSSAGKSPLFGGLFFKYTARASNSYTTLSPGESVVVDHTLGAYDFTAAGPGTYSISTSPTFLIVADEGVKIITADVSAHTVHLSGNLSANVNPKKLIVTENCSASETAALTAAGRLADTLVISSNNYLSTANQSAPGPLYTRWYGTPAGAGFNITSRYGHVQSAFTKLNGFSFENTVVYNCITGPLCDPSMVDSDAFTFTQSAGQIWICPSFFNPPGPDETRPGKLVHLGTHWDAVAHTGHWAEGRAASLELAVTWPDFAIDNADSYEYFAEDNHPQP